MSPSKRASPSKNGEAAIQKIEEIIDCMEREDPKGKLKTVQQLPSSPTTTMAIVTDFNQKDTVSPVITTPLITNLLAMSPAVEKNVGNDNIINTNNNIWSDVANTNSCVEEEKKPNMLPSKRALPSNNTKDNQKKKSSCSPSSSHFMKHEKSNKNLPRKKPRSAYSIFFREYLINNNIQNRGNDSAFFVRLSACVSDKWEKLDAETKNEYYKKAEKEKEKYATEMDDKMKVLERKKHEEEQNNHERNHVKIFEKNWNDMYLRLLNYKLMNGNCLVPHDYVDDKELGYWVHNQRLSAKKQSLPKCRQRKLDEIGFVWDDGINISRINDEANKNSSENIHSNLRMNGKENKNSVNNIDTNFDYWIQVQHQHYQHYKNGSKSIPIDGKHDHHITNGIDAFGTSIALDNKDTSEANGQADYHDNNIAPLLAGILKSSSSSSHHSDPCTIQLEECSSHNIDSSMINQEEFSMSNNVVIKMQQNRKTVRDDSSSMWNTVSKRLCRYKQAIL